MVRLDDSSVVTAITWMGWDVNFMVSDPKSLFVFWGSGYASMLQEGCRSQVAWVPDKRYSHKGALWLGAAFAATGYSPLQQLSAMQNEISCRYFLTLLAWPTGYLSSGFIPGFLKGFKRNCYRLNSGVIYNGNPVSHSSCPPQKSWALNLNLGESEAQFALFSF